jgi:hypothetical protein
LGAGKAVHEHELLDRGVLGVLADPDPVGLLPRSGRGVRSLLRVEVPGDDKLACLGRFGEGAVVGLAGVEEVGSCVEKLGLDHLVL